MTSPSTSWKEATDSTTGDATKFGAPDGLNKNNQLFNGDLNVDNVDVNSPWFFRTSKCYFLNTAGTFGFLIDSSAALAADRTITLPLLLADDTLVFQTFIQTISSKKIGNWLDHSEIAAPSSPAASEHRNYFDSTSFKYTTKNSSGTVEEFTTNSGTQTLTNKTITTPTITVLDNAFTIQDSADVTKTFVTSLGGATTAKGMTLVSSHTDDRSITLPDGTATLATLGLAETLSGVKTFTAAPVFNDNVKVSLGTGSDSTLVDTGSVAIFDYDEANVGSRSFDIQSDATSIALFNDTIATFSVPIDVPDIETATISARDGTLAQTIADSTGVTTFVSGTVLVAPVLGTPAAGSILTNCTGLPTGGVASTLDAKTLTDTVRIQNALATALGTTGTIDLDFSTGELTTMPAMTGNITFTTSNLGIGRSKTIRIIGGASAYTFTFPAWKFLGAAAPASLAIGKYAVLTLTSISTTDAEVVAAYSAQV